MEINSTAEALSYLYGLSLNQSNLRFRGQADFGWQVQPSIYRFSNFQRYQTVQFEKFLLDNRPPKPCPPLTHTAFELEWLMISQHYTVPTRLLDWTSDILIALYFACDDKDNIRKDGAVFVCNQDDYPMFNAYNERAMESQALSFVSTNVVNPRMRLQAGSFMMWDHAPLDESTRESYDLWKYHQGQDKEFFLEKLRIRSSKKKSILQELCKIYSINHDNVYLVNGYLEQRYLNQFKKLKDTLRLMTLYVTDADRLNKKEEIQARSNFKIECRNMFGQCTNLRTM
jgi:hypothetical protein